MSQTSQEPSNRNSTDIGASEADAILGNLRALRDQIVIAWRERAVVLSAEERRMLSAEIEQTCSFLKDLTRRD